MLNKTYLNEDDRRTIYMHDFFLYEMYSEQYNRFTLAYLLLERGEGVEIVVLKVVPKKKNKEKDEEEKEKDEKEEEEKEKDDGFEDEEREKEEEK